MQEEKTKFLKYYEYKFKMNVLLKDPKVQEFIEIYNKLLEMDQKMEEEKEQTIKR